MTHARSAIGPTLETERLILRPPASDDFESWAAFHADAEVGEFLGGTLSRAMAWRALCTMAGSWVINGFGMFSAVEKSSGRWVGRIGPWQPEGWPGTEVGWGLAREAWGHGYAVEGATAASTGRSKSLDGPRSSMPSTHGTGRRNVWPGGSGRASCARRSCRTR